MTCSCFQLEAAHSPSTSLRAASYSLAGQAFRYLPALFDFPAYTPQQLAAGSAAMAALSTQLSGNASVLLEAALEQSEANFGPVLDAIATATDDFVGQLDEEQDLLHDANNDRHRAMNWILSLTIIVIIGQVSSEIQLFGRKYRNEFCLWSLATCSRPPNSCHFSHLCRCK